MFINRVLETVNKFSMINTGDSILIALSGGADSSAITVFLAEIRQQYSLNLHAVYINHQLRPKEIDEEISHSKRLCESLDINFTEGTIDVKGYCKKHNISLQEGARQLRYEYLNTKSEELTCGKIAIAHNADDQAETVLMRLIRGTGVSGLAGIPPKRGKIIRPFIETSRVEIEDYLISKVESLNLDKNKPFIMDSSNLKDDYLRNKIRLQLMTEIKKINKDFINIIKRTTDIIRDEERYFDILVTKSLMKMISRKGEGYIELFWQPMESMDRAILRRLIRRAVDEVKDLKSISFINIEDIIDLIKKGKSGARIYINKDMRVIKGYSTLKITTLKTISIEQQTISSEGQFAIREASLVMDISLCSKDDCNFIEEPRQVVLIDADKAKFPLVIRARKAGDYFYPLGFGKRKKIQDFFVDEKIPRDERDVVPLLANEKDIIWIAGYRLDDRYKVDKDTKRVLKCLIRPLK
ncbi:MAG TPA: tRNA lysidine(34) synthetase TilS [Nitrospirae bacterium]|nr:tRNA lysidine(34) synthetase TilS [Nitrospirota bacterium]